MSSKSTAQKPPQGSLDMKLKCIHSNSASQRGCKATKRDLQGEPLREEGVGLAARDTPS